MTKKRISKLWTHIDDDDDGRIDADEILSLMTFIAVLYRSYQYCLAGNKDYPKLDKDKIRKHLAPLCIWIETVKMGNEHKKVGKEEFSELFGSWLQEYARNHAL